MFRFLSGRKPPATVTFPAPQPDRPLFVIGDVHGCANHLLALLAKAPDDAQIICVGDLIDRGAESARVIEILRNRPEVICLMGNHEEMLLRFLDEPSGRARRWLRHGGMETCASFGVSVSLKPGREEVVRNDLRAAMGPANTDWIASFPTIYRSGNVAVVHAGADPRRRLSEQKDTDLVWGHADFDEVPRRDGQWVIHGHTIVDAPNVQNGVISIDTGAYATGALTALHLDGATARFLTVTQDDLP